MRRWRTQAQPFSAHDAPAQHPAGCSGAERIHRDFAEAQIKSTNGMAIDYDKLLNRNFRVLEQTYTERDTMLYALSIGMGLDPLDEACLQFVYEENLKTMPSQAVVLAHPGFWAREADTGIDWLQVLHAGQEVIIHNTLPAAATVTATTRIAEITDKGPRVGALVVSERKVSDKTTGRKYCTLISTILCRGDGGFGGPRRSSPKPERVPERAPDNVCDLPTLPQQALLYRLLGDLNPLHASPEVARAAGFRAPILHGLCTFGVATHAILKSCCDYRPEQLKSLRVRFSAPVYPGDTIRTEIWQQGEGRVAFRCLSLEQDKVVINNGFATF